MRALLFSGLLCLTLACGAASQRRAPAASDDAALTPAHTPPPKRDAAEPQPSSPLLPVDVDDGVWGEPEAPVTLLVFTDLQCRFCAEAHAVLTALQRKYREERLRVVIKHVPLARHAFAVPAARVAQAVLELGGRRRFFEYLDAAYAKPEAVASGAVLELGVALQVDAEQLKALAASTMIGEQVLRDALLAEKLGITATPHFRINGLPLTGVQPLETLSAHVDAELREATTLRQRGAPPNTIYEQRVSVNISKPER